MTDLLVKYELFLVAETRGPNGAIAPIPSLSCKPHKTKMY